MDEPNQKTVEESVWAEGFLESLDTLDLLMLARSLTEFPEDKNHLREALAEIHKRKETGAVREAEK